MDVNQAFKHACKFILGEEIGEMHEYEDYLKEPVIGKFVNSSFSNETLFVTSEFYCKDAKFFNYAKDQHRINELLGKPVDINKIKDIDSLLEATKEKLVYAGGKVLGQSSNITDSDNIIDSMGVLNCSMLHNCKYMAYVYLSRNSEYIFASTSTGESSWQIRSFSTNTVQRIFECSICINTRDSYFGYLLFDCNDCMFTFNERGKSYMIGNISLGKEKYLKLKKKLLSEIIEELKKNKRLDYSILTLPRYLGMVA